VLFLDRWCKDIMRLGDLRRHTYKMPWPSKRFIILTYSIDVMIITKLLNARTKKHLYWCKQETVLPSQEATSMTRAAPDLPDHKALCDMLLGYIYSGDPFTPEEFKAAVIDIEGLTQEQQARRPASGAQPYLQNYIAHALRAFSISRFHVRGPDGRYHPTRRGRAYARACLTGELMQMHLTQHHEDLPRNAALGKRPGPQCPG
jgi:hypothetical protein